ncbi:unnamed protein product [Rotaria magnacalcarata]|uniref:Uncharacterized protein n=1 Tax=Rotaria magnacalcarata TaxID=392030 RepID=A0A815T075_9BILA|nr:unnamed protein product [Rotaria magnacalcarata]
MVSKNTAKEKKGGGVREKQRAEEKSEQMVDMGMKITCYDDSDEEILGPILAIVVLHSDSLSIHEQNFYKFYGNDLPTPPEIVHTFQQFKDNLQNRFRFDKISQFIDFSQFTLAGGSVLMSLLQNTTQYVNADLDFFLYR